ncbi:hypothetical protein [Agrococcus beijingensis]|uniref:hypothetical protein n=1 Tax=Agrococcus beijingensis TaxID=3068634 RepID=UPI00274056DD|nr:hypothetical protein [Agrococcus sp. REN33]
MPAPQPRLSRRPQRSRTLEIVAAVCLAAALVACGPQLDVDRAPSTAPSPTPTAAPLPLPADDVIALADQMLLTSEGRTVFFESQPRLADADEIVVECAGVGDAGADDRFTGGCFLGSGGTNRDADRIFVFRPADARLAESMVTVGAHELLHAVYARFEPGERAQVDALVVQAAALVPADDPVHEQIEWSVGDAEPNRANEQFAYLGSQIAIEGGFPELLEDVYALFFTDRAALVEAHRRAGAVIDDARAAAEAAWAEVGPQESANAQERAQLEADRGGYASAASTYTADLDRFNATPAEEQARWEVTLTPVGEAPITMSWQASLTYRWEQLEGFRAELEARAAALASAGATAASARAEAERLQADALALIQAANPNAATDD